MKTYLWIIATANSRSKRVLIKIEVGINKIGVASLVSLRRLKRRWPAIILAVRRTESVVGRIILEIVSISTIKNLKAIGVPKGTRWENMWFMLFNHP